MTKELSRQARRDLAIDTMASWALEGMEPTPEILADINAYVDGTMTPAQMIDKVKSAYRDKRE